jgi:hypothetical protein
VVVVTFTLLVAIMSVFFVRIKSDAYAPFYTLTAIAAAVAYIIGLLAYGLHFVGGDTGDLIVFLGMFLLCAAIYIGTWIAERA